MRTERRVGFTLVELLVVITIIGMLMALLLPAVNQSAEAARGATCKNNLAQLSKATNVLESTYNSYPGWNNFIPGGTEGTWAVRLLPFIDQKPLYNQYKAGGSVVPIFIESFICPSNPPAAIAGGENSYVANAGLDDLADDNPANGVFHDRIGANLKIGAEYISNSDGVTYTIMYSENVQASNWDELGKTGTVTVWKVSGSAADMINGELKTATAGTAPRPSSYHPGGVHIAFCDGHVVYVRESVDYQVYQQMMTPNGEESAMSQPVTPFDAASIQ